MRRTKEERSVCLQENQVQDGERQEHGRLEKQTGDRGRAGQFAEERIDTPGAAKPDGDPGKSAVAEGQIQNSQRGEDNGGQLRTRQTFAQEDRAEEHIDERRHEVAQAGFQDAIGVHRPDEHEPVEGNRDPAGHAEEHGPARSQDLAHFRPAALPAEESGEESGRPNKTVREDFRRWHHAQKFPVNGNDAPESKGGDAGEERGSLLVRAMGG